MDIKILFTRDETKLLKLDPNEFYTLAWKEFEWMKENKSVFTIKQGNLVCQAGAVNKIDHGDSCSKPTGLYLAHGRSWIDFAYKKCRYQFYKRYLYKVIINNEYYNSKIHVIDTHESALKFVKLFGIINADGSISKIKWGEVAEKHSGISILNWTKSDNKSLLWYNDFEASQLVIWNATEGDLQYHLEVDAYSNNKLFLKPKVNCILSGGKKKRRKTRRKRNKFTNKKKRTKMSTSRKARYSRKKRRFRK